MYLKSKIYIEFVFFTGTFVIVWKKGATLLSAGQQMISREPRFSLLGYNLQVRDIRHSDQGDYTCQIGDGSQGDLIHTIEILSKFPLKNSFNILTITETNGYYKMTNDIFQLNIQMYFVRKMCHENSTKFDSESCILKRSDFNEK